MTPDWILVVGTLVFAITTWATLNFGYAAFRALGERDDGAASPVGLTASRPAGPDGPSVPGPSHAGAGPVRPAAPPTGGDVEPARPPVQVTTGAAARP